MLLWYSCVYNIAVFSSWFFLFSFLFMFSLYLTDSYLSIIYLFVVYVGYGFFFSAFFIWYLYSLFNIIYTVSATTRHGVYTVQCSVTLKDFWEKVQYSEFAQGDPALFSKMCTHCAVVCTPSLGNTWLEDPKGYLARRSPD